MDKNIIKQFIDKGKVSLEEAIVISFIFESFLFDRSKGDFSFRIKLTDKILSWVIKEVFYSEEWSKGRKDVPHKIRESL